MPAFLPALFAVALLLQDSPPQVWASLDRQAEDLYTRGDLKEAIRVANDSRFGLGASAWTNDDGERERFINDIQSGMVFINRMVASDPRLPFGGVKWSGHGRELGVHGIREFTDIKTVWIQ